jgi:hypothetical protein
MQHCAALEHDLAQIAGEQSEIGSRKTGEKLIGLDAVEAFAV